MEECDHSNVNTDQKKPSDLMDERDHSFTLEPSYNMILVTGGGDSRSPYSTQFGAMSGAESRLNGGIRVHAPQQETSSAAWLWTLCAVIWGRSGCGG
eukprot:1158705-Pelagomonas_calceolata.AAC.15